MSIGALKTLNQQLTEWDSTLHTTIITCKHTSQSRQINTPRHDYHPKRKE